ncbi:MAG: T9SS type A sorting domain-containing protein [Calditrichaeota bacterium]|nr:T9SS type A sorting domain-containing protein [Calditrichota bacterium]
MSPIFRSILPIFLPVLAIAQVVIRPGDIPRQGGTFADYWAATDTTDGIAVDPGQAGEDRFWDFSDYQFDTIERDSLLDREDAPSAEAFPTANRIVRTLAGAPGDLFASDLQYEAVTDSGWYLLGFDGEGFGGEPMPVVFPNPPEMLDLPAEYGAAWDIGARFEIGFPAPDTLAALFDSVYIRLTLGGDSELDAWGTLRFSGGDMPVLRQRTTLGGRITVVGTRVIFNRRVEVELPFGFEIPVSIAYRFLSPGVGEIASITSLPGENDPDFQVAGSIRVRRVIPALAVDEPLLAFGIVHPGNAGTGTLHIANRGEGAGRITEVTFSGGLGSEIELLTPLPVIVPPDSSARLRFLWSPQVEKSLFPERVFLHHNDPELENPLSIPLQGATPDYAAVPDETAPVPTGHLLEAFPNPFNGLLTIRFSVPTAGIGNLLKLTDVNGREIAQRRLPFSIGITAFDLHDYPAGLYLIELRSSGTSLIRAVYLVK